MSLDNWKTLGLMCELSGLLLLEHYLRVGFINLPTARMASDQLSDTKTSYHCELGLSFAERSQPL